MKRIGFLSFGHWQNAPWSRTRTAREALTQTIELAEAAEALGIGEIAPAIGWQPSPDTIGV